MHDRRRCRKVGGPHQTLTTRRSRPPGPRSQKRLKCRPSVSRPLSSLQCDTKEGNGLKEPAGSPHVG